MEESKSSTGKAPNGAEPEEHKGDGGGGGAGGQSLTAEASHTAAGVKKLKRSVAKLDLSGIELVLDTMKGRYEKDSLAKVRPYGPLSIPDQLFSDMLVMLGSFESMFKYAKHQENLHKRHVKEAMRLNTLIKDQALQLKTEVDLKTSLQDKVDSLEAKLQRANDELDELRQELITVRMENSTLQAAQPEGKRHLNASMPFSPTFQGSNSPMSLKRDMNGSYQSSIQKMDDTAVLSPDQSHSFNTSRHISSPVPSFTSSALGYEVASPAGSKLDPARKRVHGPEWFDETVSRLTSAAADAAAALTALQNAPRVTSSMAASTASSSKGGGGVPSPVTTPGSQSPARQGSRSWQGTPSKRADDSDSSDDEPLGLSMEGAVKVTLDPHAVAEAETLRRTGSNRLSSSSRDFSSKASFGSPPAHLASPGPKDTVRSLISSLDRLASSWRRSGGSASEGNAESPVRRRMLALNEESEKEGPSEDTGNEGDASSKVSQALQAVEALLLHFQAYSKQAILREALQTEGMSWVLQRLKTLDEELTQQKGDMQSLKVYSANLARRYTRMSSSLFPSTLEVADRLQQEAEELMSKFSDGGLRTPRKGVRSVSVMRTRSTPKRRIPPGITAVEPEEASGGATISEEPPQEAPLLRGWN